MRNQTVTLPALSLESKNWKFESKELNNNSSSKKKRLKIELKVKTRSENSEKSDHLILYNDPFLLHVIFWRKDFVNAENGPNVKINFNWQMMSSMLFYREISYDRLKNKAAAWPWLCFKSTSIFKWKTRNFFREKLGLVSKSLSIVRYRTQNTSSFLERLKVCIAAHHTLIRCK